MEPDDAQAAETVEYGWADQKLLSAFWAVLAARLDSALARHPASRAARLAARNSVYAAARRELVDVIALRFRTVSPFYAERVPLDNASLLARLVYSRELDLFDELWELEERDLRRTIERVIALARSRFR